MGGCAPCNAKDRLIRLALSAHEHLILVGSDSTKGPTESLLGQQRCIRDVRSNVSFAQLRTLLLQFGLATRSTYRYRLALPAGHARQCVGLTLIHLLFSAAIHPPTTRRQGKATVWRPSFSITANSRSPTYGAVAIGFQSMSVARRFALGVFSQVAAAGRIYVINLFAHRTSHQLKDLAP